MAKANNSGRTKKSYNYKPYDTSNSFVKRITAKVSEILPQSPSWVSRLFSPAPKLNVREREELEEEDEEEEERQPPSKRLCFGPRETSDYTHQNNINRVGDLDRESGEISPILSSRLDEERAVPGPSGLHLRNFVSSTPAARPQPPVDVSPKPTPRLLKKTPASELKKNSIKRSSLNLSSSNTLSSPSQPSFDTFVFKNPLNKSGLRSRSSLNESCFYTGETTYGGASARVSSPIDQPKARVVNVKASPTLQRDTIGTSALRILKALEQFSTPVLDAKKIPVRTELNNSRKRKPPQPYEELIFPTMPELLSIKRREVVNKPTETEAQKQPPTTSADVAVPSTTFSASPVPKVTATASSSSAEYSLRTESMKETHIGSIKGRQKDEELETERVPVLKLPNVQLKISSLPKFDLTTPSQEVKSLPPQTKTKYTTQSPSEFKFSEPEILEKVSTEKVIPNLQVGTFTFSEPLTSIEFEKKTTHSIDTHDCASYTNPNETSLSQMKSSSNFKLKKKSTEPANKSIKSFELKMPSEMKSGSIMDVFCKKETTIDSKLKQSENTSSASCSKCKSNYDKNKGKCTCETIVETGNKAKPNVSEQKWECKKCQCKNEKSDLKCKQCNLQKEIEPAKTTFKGFDGYKKPTDSWECKECFVMNKNSISTCVSCSTPKAGKGSSVSAGTTSGSTVFSFSSGKNNIESVSKTTTPFVPIVNSIKKPQGSWECSTCLVQNKADDNSCVACTTKKPGSGPVDNAKPSFSFGVPATKAETNSFKFGINTNAQKNDVPGEKQVQFTFGGSNDDKKNSLFKFGTDHKNEVVSKPNLGLPPFSNSLKKSDKWECSTCLVQNKNDVTSCVACSAPKPGSVNAEEKSKPSFSFGLPNPSTNSSSVNSAPFGSSIRVQTTETGISQPQFTFGKQADEKKNTNFEFGSSDKSSINKPTFTFNSEKPKESDPPKAAPSSLFSFGANTNAKENKSVDDDGNPPKKKVSFGKQLVSEKHVTNDTSPTIFGNILSSKSNDIGSSNFAFNANSPFENNSTGNKEFTKEPPVNAFTFGNSDNNMNVKSSLSEQTKPVGFNMTPAEPVAISNNEHPNPPNIFGGSFTGFKPPETENKPFSFVSNTPSGQFTFNAATNAPAPAPAEPFGSQPPAAGQPIFAQQQQTPAPSLFSQQSEPKPFVFGAPSQPSSVFTFTATPQQGAAVGGSAPTFGGFAPPSSTPTPVFDPNVKPTFNFTGGNMVNFTVGSAPNNTGDVHEKRKVRKAIRRTTTQHR